MGHNATGESQGKIGKVWIYVILLFQIALIGSLIRGLQLSYRSRDRVKLLEATKDKLVSDNEELKKQENYVKSDYYVEKVAREELQRAKLGETVVILPDSGQIQAKEQLEPRKYVERANWQKWWDLLVK